VNFYANSNDSIMANYGNIVILGASGTEYEFTAYSPSTDLGRVGAVYVATYRHINPNGGYSHTVKYIGQTGNMADRLLTHTEADCFWKERVNCICVLKEENGQKRSEIKVDLLSNYSPACNE